MNDEEKSPRDDERVLDHVYDGIEEYDNPMPRWWVWTFWATAWFSLAYLFHFWIGNGMPLEGAYEAEMAVVRAEEARAALGRKPTEESLGAIARDATSLKRGGEIFAQRCAPCHGEKGQGVIGPNLTDGSWLHGNGSLLDLHETIARGVPEKGMPAWDRQLAPRDVRQVVAFVGSLRGTNVPGKAAEGRPAH